MSGIDGEQQQVIWPQQAALIHPPGPSEAPQEPQSANGNCIDQMIEDTISKVTAHIPQSHMQPAQTLSRPQVPESTFSTSVGNSDHMIINSPSLDPSIPTSHEIRSFALQTQTFSANAGIKNLPQDILHILESDFATANSVSYSGKEKEISRIAEELRVQARLSRYQRARDQLADSEDENGLEGENSGGSESGSSDDEPSEAEDKVGLDGVDGSGDEDEERVKNEQALAKLKVEIEQIIGIREHSPPSNLVEPEKPGSDVGEEEAPMNSVNAANFKIVGASLSYSKEPTENLLNGEPAPQLVEPLLQSDSAQADPSVTAPATATSTETKTPVVKVDEDIKLSSKKTANSSNVSKACKKPQTKPPVRNQDDSGDETDEAMVECDAFAGPKTAHELKEPPPEVIEVPFKCVSEAEMKTISPFGVIASLIGDVLVIKGTPGMGYDRVLDEGTLVCCKSGLVIGKIFETFGSVTNPHYSIRLPSHILASSGTADEDLNLSPGVELCYIPTHSKFVFTSELRAQPRGTDASNLFDEEVDHGEEIEFSDDEAEAAYLKACKLAKKASAAVRHSKNIQPQDQRRENSNSSSFHVTQEGRKMFVKQRFAKLNYDDVEGDSNPKIESDYSVLERPKGICNNSDHLDSISTSATPSNRPTPNPRSKGKRRAGARGRNQLKGLTQQHYTPSNRPTPSSSATFEPATAQISNSHPNQNSGQLFQSNQQTNTGFTNFNHHLLSNLNSYGHQAATSIPSMMMAQGQINDPRIAGLPTVQCNQNMAASTFWNGGTNDPRINHQISMMNPMVMMNNLPNGRIPCYNPLMPSINSNFPVNFGFGPPSLDDNPHLNNNFPTNQLISHQSPQAQTFSNINNRNNSGNSGNNNNGNSANHSFNLNLNPPHSNQVNGHFNPNFTHFNSQQFCRPP